MGLYQPDSYHLKVEPHLGSESRPSIAVKRCFDPSSSNREYTLKIPVHFLSSLRLLKLYRRPLL